MPASPSSRPEEPLATPLTDLVAWLGARCVGDPSATVVTGLTLSSQRVRPGDLYAALPGASRHGAAFADDAVAAGAVAVLTDAAGCEQLGPTGVPVLVLEDLRPVLGALAARVYGEPAAALTLMAVTGTQGKTTTTRLLEAGLELAGIPAAVVGTVGTRIAGHDVRTALTTPEAPDLHALFAVMREHDVVGCAMEVSSHALVMGRVDGVVFDVAAFANLGRDHLDFHADMEEYFAAKASLFTPEHARLGLTNVDDEHGRRLLEVAGIPMRTFSPSGADADWRAVDVELAPEGSRFTVIAPDGARIAAGVPLTGAFNVANALCAVALAAEAGFDPVVVAAGIAASHGVPGRLERIDGGQDFLVVVDYAHKPDALEAAVAAVRPLTTGKLVVVIGAGGDRDTGKRPLMGEIGARLADVLVVTDDNPRSEDPTAIRRAVLDGADQVPSADRAEVLELGDRREAIRRAIASAGPGDTVLIAGKGHETGQEVGVGPDKVVHPFDDRDEARAALAALGEAGR
ncbi:UDP-N-acetylmuramoyl-L-alanyl-D-glutamate--2,6-diaminopimelate ligase [Nocardioides marmorisolisilvae]|uniref:UDP-N-acetylmuramoyl-L-alanyl-D-glutamate--2,6-diaminopimelate ligase n=1 Tax=Nocardioides marmorisolisilvae TaxID=1542737 RepID=A0A3N0DVT2_9ACTN|nr:UDP-N-acetylmuramoyl-L-alanyl-D-glutamate--2,6-diaminopimelate ligase [Nocardioides marmorisolisilvae]RNL79727.1 UDP-N-acetylmuramoyl-L-alanyl-D-glutamate--2,6-diaminopimelate ligase [Nocardioides marmorisolisilvae]